MDLYSKPMGVGAILDRSFQLYRKHFSVAFLLVLVFYGPIYLLSNLLTMDIGALSWLPSGENTLEDAFNQYWEVSEDPGASALALAVTFLIMPLYFLFAFPASVSSMLHLVQGSLQGAEVSFKDVWKKSFHRFWPAVGGTLLFGLMIIAIQIVVIIALIIVFGVATGIMAAVGATFQFLDNPIGGGIIFAVGFAFLYLLLMFSIAVLFSYFFIRFGFYLPPVILEKDSIGIGRSWKLTRNSFWRIFAVMFVVTILYSIFSLGVYGVLILLKLSIVGIVLYTLLSLMVTPAFLILYAVIYFDCRVRNDAADLELLLNRLNAREVNDRVGENIEGAEETR